MPIAIKILFKLALEVGIYSWVEENILCTQVSSDLQKSGGLESTQDKSLLLCPEAVFQDYIKVPKGNDRWKRFLEILPSKLSELRDRLADKLIPEKISVINKSLPENYRFPEDLSALERFLFSQSTYGLSWTNFVPKIYHQEDNLFSRENSLLEALRDKTVRTGNYLRVPRNLQTEFPYLHRKMSMIAKVIGMVLKGDDDIVINLSNKNIWSDDTNVRDSAIAGISQQVTVREQLATSIALFECLGTIPKPEQLGTSQIGRKGALYIIETSVQQYVACVFKIPERQQRFWNFAPNLKNQVESALTSVLGNKAAALLMLDTIEIVTRRFLLSVVTGRESAFIHQSLTMDEVNSVIQENLKDGGDPIAAFVALLDFHTERLTVKGSVAFNRMLPLKERTVASNLPNPAYADWENNTSKKKGNPPSKTITGVRVEKTLNRPHIEPEDEIVSPFETTVLDRLRTAFTIYETKRIKAFSFSNFPSPQGWWKCISRILDKIREMYRPLMLSIRDRKDVVRATARATRQMAQPLAGDRATSSTPTGKLSPEEWSNAKSAVIERNMATWDAISNDAVCNAFGIDSHRVDLLKVDSEWYLTQIDKMFQRLYQADETETVRGAAGPSAH